MLIMDSSLDSYSASCTQMDRGPEEHFAKRITLYSCPTVRRQCAVPDVAPSAGEKVTVPVFVMGFKLKIKRPITATQDSGASAVPAQPASQALPASSVANGHYLPSAPSFSAVSSETAEPAKKKPKLKLKKSSNNVSKPVETAQPANHVQSTTRQSQPAALRTPLPHATAPKPLLSQKRATGSKRSLRTASPAEQASPQVRNTFPVDPDPAKKKPKKLKLKASKASIVQEKVEVRKVLPVAPLGPMLPASAPKPATLGAPLMKPAPPILPKMSKKLKIKPAMPTRIKIKKLQTTNPTVASAPAQSPPAPATANMKALPVPALGVRLKRSKPAPKPQPQAEPAAVRSAAPTKPLAPVTSTPSEPEPLKEGTAFYESLAADIPEENIVPERALMVMVNRLMRKDKDNTFKVEPQKGALSSRIKNAYKATIKHPMALTTIKECIRSPEGNKLRTWDQMALALDLMVANCVKFNSTDSPISKAAAAIRAEFDRIRERDKAAAAAERISTEEAVEMPRLRSAVAPEQPLPPRRAAAMANMAAREHAAPSRRGGGRGGGRVPRTTTVNMRMVNFGIKRTVELNARASFYKRTEDTACFGAALGGWNIETGRSWWLNRPKLGHAYRKKYIPFNFCALKTAFHVGRLRGTMLKEVSRRAALTIYAKPAAAGQAQPPAVAQQPAHHVQAVSAQQNPMYRVAQQGAVATQMQVHAAQHPENAAASQQHAAVRQTQVVQPAAHPQQPQMTQVHNQQIQYQASMPGQQRFNPAQNVQYSTQRTAPQHQGHAQPVMQQASAQ